MSLVTREISPQQTAIKSASWKPWGVVLSGGFSEARALQASAELLVHWQPREFATMVPGKLYEYIESGRPIVALLDPELEAAALLRRADAVILAPGDRVALSAELERRYREWKVQGRQPAAAREWIREYARDHLSGQLAQVLDGVMEAPLAQAVNA